MGLLSIKSDKSKFLNNKLVTIFAVAVFYFLGARLGLLIAFENTNASPIWIPSGMAFAIMLIAGRKIWPGIFFGAFFANLSVFMAHQATDTTTEIITSLAIASGNTLEALAGSFLMKRFIKTANLFEKYQNIFWFIAIDVSMCAISSTIGTTSLCLSQIATWHIFGTIWNTWFLGDFSAILIITPLILSWHQNHVIKWKSQGILEQIVITLFIVFFAETIFIRHYSFGDLSSRLYVLVPFLLWMVFRFGNREIISTLAIVSAFAIWGTVQGKGPFISDSINDSLLQLISFIVIITVTFMALSASLAESKATLIELKNHKHNLENKIIERTHGIEKINLKLLREIMEKEKAEEFLRNKSNKLNEAQQIAHIGSWEWDIKTGKEIWSDEQFRVFGYEPGKAEATYDLFLNILYPTDKEAVLEAIKLALDGNKDFNMEYRIITKDNRIKFIDARAKVFRNNNGIPVKMIGTVQDITLRKEAEEKIRNLSEFQNIILNGTEYSIISADNKGIVTTFNKGAELMLGYKAEEFVGICGPEKIHDYDEVVNRARELSEELSVKLEPGFDVFVAKSRLGYADVNEWTYIRKNGSRITVELSVTTLRNYENVITGYLGIAKDITEQNLLTKELHRAKQFAEESSRLAEIFLANMSHEIRTPMNAIVGFTSLLTDTKLNNKQTHLVSNINSASENLLGIINNILDLSKIESGLMQIEDRVVHLPSLLESVHSIVMGNALEKKLDISLSINPKLPEYIYCDPIRISQILINLTSNAIKFTEKGFVNIRAEAIRTDSQKVNIKFIVQDSGIGIAKENCEIIFDRFKQESVETFRKYGGTGLGLSIVKNIVKLLDGELSVASELGTGTEFTVIIPFNLCGTEEIEKHKRSQIPQESPDKIKLGNLNILLVEDNRMNQQYVSLILKDLNFKCTIALNGKEALKKLKEENFDLILMDIQLPEMDGYETTHIIRNDFNNQIPILGLTASALSDEQLKCFNMGMNGYMSKPFKPKELHSKIIEILTNRENQKSIGFNDRKTCGILEEKLVVMNTLKDQVKGNISIVKELLEIFLEDTPADLKMLEAAVIDADYERIEKTAHQLISSFGIIGIGTAVMALRAIEHNAKNKREISEIKKFHLQLTEITEHARIQINELNISLQ